MQFYLELYIGDSKMNAVSFIDFICMQNILASALTDYRGPCPYWACRDISDLIFISFCDIRLGPLSHLMYTILCDLILGARLLRWVPDFLSQIAKIRPGENDVLPIRLKDRVRISFNLIRFS